jgi:putative sterol carrier protein
MTLQESVDTLRTKVAKVNDLNSVLKFDCGADGTVVIDGKASPHTVELASRDDADVVITLSADNFAGIVTGKVNPGIAFVMGKIKVKGDKSPLLKLQKIL